MDIDLLKTFLEVQQTRHFGRSAEHLCVTQAAVSARIRQLETMLGAQLFARERNNIRLTRAGERFLPYAESIVGSWGAARQQIALLGGTQQRIAIAAPANIWSCFFDAALLRLYTQMPNASLIAEVVSADRLIRGLLSSSYDLIFTFTPALVDKVISQQISSIELILASSFTDSLNEALAGPYIMIDWGTEFEMQQGRLFADGQLPILQTDNGQTGLRLLMDKGGSAYVPKELVTVELASGRLRKVKQAEVISKPIYVMYREDATNIEAIKLAIKNLGSARAG